VKTNHFHITNPRLFVPALAALTLGFTAVAVQPAAAQRTGDGDYIQPLPSTPTITSLWTQYGPKEGVPAVTAFQNFTIKGMNFNPVASQNAVRIYKWVALIGGTPGWQHVATATPSYATANMLTVNIGNPGVGAYRVAVALGGNRVSNAVDMQVVSSAVSLQTVTPGMVKAGQTVTLKGNLFPQTGTKVVLTPPAEIAKYMGTRYITPTSQTPFDITFNMPADIWEGDWTVKVVGYMAATNEKPLEVYTNTTDWYMVEVKKIICLEETDDGSVSDEAFLSAIVYTPQFTGFNAEHSASSHGSLMFTDVDAGDILDLYDPNNPSELTWSGFIRSSLVKTNFILGVSECDQWTSMYGSWWWNNLTEERYYAKQRADFAISDTAFAQSVLGILPGDGPGWPQILEYMKNKLYEMLNNDDDAVGVQNLKFTLDEVYTARLKDGAPLVKVLEFQGDGGKYQVEVHLRLAK
jgi:hypothetical protein